MISSSVKFVAMDKLFILLLLYQVDISSICAAPQFLDFEIEDESTFKGLDKLGSFMEADKEDKSESDDDFANFGKSPFSKGFLSRSDSKKFSGEGELDKEGFFNSKSFDEALKGLYNVKGDKARFNDRIRKVSAKVNAADYYAQKDAVADGAGGVGFDEKKDYKKGTKEVGFHNMEHKDEYKKKRLFYDESDSEGHYRRFANQGKAYRAGRGGKVRNGAADKTDRKTEGDRTAFYDRGALDKQLKGFSKNRGFDGKFAFKENASKKSEDVNKASAGFDNK